MEFIFGNDIKKTLYRVFLIVLFAYVGTGIVMYLFQRDFIYFPTDRDFWSCDISDTDSQKIEIDGERALFAQRDPLNNSNRIIIFYHGNQDSACNWRYIPRHFGFAGDDTLVVEYPGYAGDDRPITKENLFGLVDTIEQWTLEQGYAEVYLVSYSLGGALASYHASKEVDRVLMFAPFDSLINVVWDKHLYYPEFMLHDDYNNAPLINQSNSRIMIMHGADDAVVNPERSATLAAQLHDGTLIERVVIPNKGHQNLLDGNEFSQIIDRFLLE